MADLRAHSVWQPQVDILFNVRVVDTDAPFYQGRTPKAVLHIAETEKQRKYVPCCSLGWIYPSVIFC